MLSVLAHNVGADSLPAPSWLLGYLGALAVLGTAAWLRGGWTTPRLPSTAREAPEAWDDTTAPAPRGKALAGQVVGLALLVLVFVIAVVGTDSAAENVAPVAVFIVWMIVLPLLCLVVGDVMRAINPFQPIVALLERVTGRTGDPAGAPRWTSAAFLFAFSWVFLAYHRPGSPRVVAVTLGLYTLAAVAGGLRWGRAWLAGGEGFGALSAGVARITHQAGGPRPPGLLPLAVVWIGATAFDGLSETEWWIDVLGNNAGWDRTLLNTVGLVWMTAIVAAVALVALRLAEASPATEATDDESTRGASLAPLLGLVLVPVAAAWFLTDNLSLLLLEGQNFIALLSDPLGRGWDLFGTIDNSIDYRLAQGDWVQWVQLLGLLAGHLGAVVLAHDGALARLGRRRGMRVTWAVAGATAVSFVAAALVVLG